MQNAFPYLKFVKVKVGTPKGKQEQGYTFRAGFYRFSKVSAAQNFVKLNLSEFTDLYYTLDNSGYLIPLSLPSVFKGGSLNESEYRAFIAKAMFQGTLDKSGDRSFVFPGVGRLQLPTITELGRKVTQDPGLQAIEAFKAGLAELALHGIKIPKGLLVKGSIKGSLSIGTTKETQPVRQAQRERKAMGSRRVRELQYSELAAGARATLEFDQYQRSDEQVGPVGGEWILTLSNAYEKFATAESDGALTAQEIYANKGPSRSSDNPQYQNGRNAEDNAARAPRAVRSDQLLMQKDWLEATIKRIDKMINDGKVDYDYYEASIASLLSKSAKARGKVGALKDVEPIRQELVQLRDDLGVDIAARQTELDQAESEWTKLTTSTEFDAKSKDAKRLRTQVRKLGLGLDALNAQYTALSAEVSAVGSKDRTWVGSTESDEARLDAAKLTVKRDAVKGVATSEKMTTDRKAYMAQLENINKLLYGEPTAGEPNQTAPVKKGTTSKAGINNIKDQVDKRIADLQLTPKELARYEQLKSWYRTITKIMGTSVSATVVPMEGAGGAGNLGRVSYNYFGPGKHLIEVDRTLLNAEKGQAVLGFHVLAHEVAHIFTEKMLSESANVAAVAKMYAAQSAEVRAHYEGTRDGDPQKEWVTDQLAIRMFEESKKLKTNPWEAMIGQSVRGVVPFGEKWRSGVLDALAKRLKSFYRLMTAVLKRQNIISAPEAQAFLENLSSSGYWGGVRAYYTEGASTELGSASFGAMAKDSYTDVRQAAIDSSAAVAKFSQENPGVVRKMTAVKALTRGIWNSNGGRSFQKIFNYGDNILRAISPEIADMFSHEIGKTKGLKYLEKRDARTREFSAEIDSMVEKMGEAEFQRAASEVERTEQGPLTGNAKIVSDWLNGFYTNYAKKAMPTLGKIEGNFFSRIYDTSAIIERRDQFEALVAKHLYARFEREHKAKNPGTAVSEKRKATQETQFAQTAKDITGRLLETKGVFDMEFDTRAAAQGAKNIPNLGRVLNLGPEFTRELNTELFTYSDRIEAMHYYIGQTVKRGEWEKAMGGYFEAEGIPIENTRENGDVADSLVGPTTAKFIDGTPKLKQLFTDKFKAGPFDAGAPTEQVIDSWLISTGYAVRRSTQIPGGQTKSTLMFYRPSGHLQDKLEALREKDPQQANDAELIIDGYMGRLGADMNASLRKTQGWAVVVQSYLTMAFAAVASVPDFAGIILRGRDARGMQQSFKGMMRAIVLYKDAKESARILGMLNERASVAGLMARYGADFMSPSATKWMGRLFSWNGQEALTNMTRVFAVASAETVIADLATRTDAAADRYLSDLGLDRQDVVDWLAGGLTGPKSEKIRNAVQQFTDESVLRPNASQRPIWANDPRYALLWHLKSFTYAFGKVVVGGMLTESQISAQKGNLMNAALGPVVMAATFMPLAALALFTRGLVQYDMWEDDGENLDPYEEMAFGRYMFELSKRSGFMGPLEMLYGFAKKDDTGDAVLSLAGPTVDHLHTLLSDPLQNKINRSIPLWAQLYGAHEQTGVK